MAHVLGSYSEAKSGTCFFFETRCSKGQIGAIVGGVLAALLLIGIVIVAVVYFKRQLARSEENKARINARLAGEDEILVSYILPA